MSITDELREYAKGRTDYRPRERLLAIADRIDRQCWRECDKAYIKGFCDGTDADKNAMGYVKLPVDADGVPIHVGDRMAFEDGEEFDVIGISDSTLFFMDDDFADAAAWTQAGNKHHVQPDSWERIIEDAIIYANSDTQGSRERFVELVERCKRLAGDAE